ncbi:hypothetical protein DPMN_135313 [Dreissena polymorpha]|uniref:Uncharacterized protein n=1 Tax=Dreissena polymorpha TaxID=45954 RepID=A0A9D4FYT2_DREPO|nr:hypothetical protein DPMN_135313 [Dreissena polymorpha]
MCFIKRDNDETTDYNGELFNNDINDRLLEDVQNKAALENSPQYGKRYFDRLSSGFIRKKRSTAQGIRRLLLIVYTINTLTFRRMKIKLNPWNIQGVM